MYIVGKYHVRLTLYYLKLKNLGTTCIIIICIYIYIINICIIYIIYNDDLLQTTYIYVCIYI